MKNTAYLGTSTRTKVSFDSKGQLEYAVGMNNVIQSIGRALKIDGDGFFNRGKKSQLSKLRFQPRDLATADLLKLFIREAIEKNVQSVASISIQTEFPDNQPELINASIFFTIKQGNAKGNFVYPFFLQNSQGLQDI